MPDLNHRVLQRIHLLLLHSENFSSNLLPLKCFLVSFQVRLLLFCVFPSSMTLVHFHKISETNAFQCISSGFSIMCRVQNPLCLGILLFGKDFTRIQCKYKTMEHPHHTWPPFHYVFNINPRKQSIKHAHTYVHCRSSCKHPFCD